jgi:hypothetical protein
MASDQQRNILLKLVQGEEGKEWADKQNGWNVEGISGKALSCGTDASKIGLLMFSRCCF